ncbi:hypothetical protein DFH07DRAFT_810004 [Mycena maculata]|uniref:Uncharacterized protein n=1 Tax=Mycena maculata TaxID=230809 RepID=A0AAD7JM88_9AGAR|nr:hypothetical protein DFH07DRAFT_810004 [Mycena maculata]
MARSIRASKSEPDRNLVLVLKLLACIIFELWRACTAGCFPVLLVRECVFRFPPHNRRIRPDAIDYVDLVSMLNFRRMFRLNPSNSLGVEDAARNEWDPHRSLEWC